MSHPRLNPAASIIAIATQFSLKVYLLVLCQDNLFKQIGFIMMPSINVQVPNSPLVWKNYWDVDWNKMGLFPRFI